MSAGEIVGAVVLYVAVFGTGVIIVNLDRDPAYSLSEVIALGILWPLLLLRFIGREWPPLLGRIARDMYRLTAGER